MAAAAEVPAARPRCRYGRWRTRVPGLLRRGCLWSTAGSCWGCAQRQRRSREVLGSRRPCCPLREPPSAAAGSLLSDFSLGPARGGHQQDGEVGAPLPVPWGCIPAAGPFTGGPSSPAWLSWVPRNSTSSPLPSGVGTGGAAVKPSETESRRGASGWGRGVMFHGDPVSAREEGKGAGFPPGKVGRFWAP